MFNGERIISSTNLLVGRYNLTTRTGRTRKLINVNPRMKKMIYKNAKIKTKTTVVVRQKEETPAAKYPTYKTWRILYSSTPSSRIPYTCGIRFFNENGALLELNLKKIFRSGAGGSGNWAKHQPGNFDLNFSYAQAVSGDKWFGHHFETTQMISKIHIGSTASLNHIPTYSWGSLLGGRSFPEFLIQGSNNASNTEIGGLRTTMTGNWTTIMTVTANDLYEPATITDTKPTAAKGESTSYIQGNQLTMRIIELPTS